MPRFGAFGKIPALGDFIRVGLDAEFVRVWDAWLQERLPVVRDHLGPGWQSFYMAAPIWRFTLAPGVVGNKGWIGVIMASVDRVGRQFPLTIVGPLGSGADPARAHFENDALFEALEDAALRALDDDTDRDRFIASLGDLPEQDQDTASLHMSPERITLRAPLRTAARARLAAAAIGARNALSLWSSDTGEGVRFIATSQLPTANEMAGFFDLSAPVWQEPSA